MPRPRVTFSRNGMTSSGRSGPPNETSRNASYAGMPPSNQCLRDALGSGAGLWWASWDSAADDGDPAPGSGQAGRPHRRRAGATAAAVCRGLPHPGAWRFSMAGVIGRLPMSMFGLGTVLLISAVTGGYGVAGTVSAVGSLGYAFCSPQVARLGDSRGQRRVLLPVVAVFGASTAALIAAVQAHAPTWVFFVPGAVA